MADKRFGRRGRMVEGLCSLYGEWMEEECAMMVVFGRIGEEK